ncbi:MAG: AMP-binding protein [Promethearchaeota archaeon]|jgi:long-chain acyl-CoA synthetase
MESEIKLAEWQVNEDKPWFKKWWPKDTPKNYEFEKISLGEFFERQRKKYASDNMMWFLESWMTYEEAGQKIDSLATALHKLGVKKGDVVAFLMPNCFQYVISFYATVKLGAIATGINPTYKPLEILHHFKITGATILIALDSLYEELAEPVIKRSKVEMVIYTNVADLASGVPGFKKVLGKLIGKIPKGKVNFPSALKFMDLLETEPDLPKVDFDPTEHTATYIMTGGTTGVPKATILSHFNLVSNATQAVLWVGGEDPGVGDIGALPLFHSFAMTAVMNVAIGLGGWMMLFPRPPPTREFLKEISHIPAPKGLFYTGAEILFKRIADFPNLNKKFPNLMGKLRLSISGAGPLHTPVRDAFEKSTGGRIVEGYGLSEASPVVSGGNLFGESPVGVIGMPFPGTDWGIFDVDEFEKGPIADGLSGSKYGEENTGELCVCGPQVMKGYLNKPEETSDTLKKWDGRTWLLTGDIGFMNEDGTVALRDRKKQLIKVAGHSVFPAEVETMLMSNKAVSEAAVAGLPDPKGKVGEITKAWVALKPEYEGKITEEELIAWTERNMTKWKCPAIIEFIDEVPKNILGKVQRRILQEADPLYKK